MIKIETTNETHIRVFCDDFGIEQEISDAFMFFVPGYKYTPKFKAGIWDGRVRLFDSRRKTLYKGLLPVLEKLLNNLRYEYEIVGDPSSMDDIPMEEVDRYIASLHLHARGKPIELTDYQKVAIHHGLSHHRSILLSSTSSGKSAMIFSIIRKRVDEGKKVVLIVPNISLVHQMYSDFEDYSSGGNWSVPDHVHRLFGGEDRDFSKGVIISTWQSLFSIMKNDPKLFREISESTDVIIGDEAHGCKSQELGKLIEAFKDTKYRIGTTGTMDGSKINELVLTGLFGPIKQIITARQLIDAKKASPIDIRILLLKHPEQYRKAFKGMQFQEEINHVVGCAERNRFISKLAVACSGNTLILFNFVNKQGQVLYDEVKKYADPDRPVHFIHGGVDGEERESIRKIVETQSNAIILATSSIMSTGTNIPSLENLIFTLPGKSNNKIRQAIGRGLRLKEGKDKCKVFDIADSYCYKSWRNTLFRHMEERIRIYIREEFDYKVKEIDLDY